MSDEPRIVTIPPEIAYIFGEPDPGTRIYRRDGTQEENSVWFDAVCEVAGPTVSPGGAGMYAPVSRAAVHQRMKEGKLSAFLFHPKRKGTNWLGRPREMRESAYCYVPVCELKLWAEEIKERAIKQGKITREELEGDKPDWEGDFLEWQNEKERTGLREFMEDTDLSGFDILKMIFGIAPKDYEHPQLKEYMEEMKANPESEIHFCDWLEKKKGQSSKRKRGGK